MSKKYFARLSDSTAKKRKSFWKKLGTYPFTKDEYDRAKEVPGDSKKTRSSKYNKKYKMMFGEEKKRSITALKNKSKASGVPYSILKQVYNRGMAAWVTGHRPGATQSAWAFARVNSFLTKGKTWYGPDADLAKKARKYLKEETSSKARIPGEYVYHASYLPNQVEGIRSIIKNGLRPSKEGYGGPGVYFAYEPEGGLYHVSKEEATIFRAKWSDLISKFGTYPDNPNGIQRDDEEIIVPGIVPASMLEVEYFPDEWWDLKSAITEETQSKVSYAWYWHPIEGILIQAYDPMSSLGKHDSMASKYGFEDIDEFPRGQFYVDNSSVNTYTDGPFTSITTYNWAGKEYQDKMPKDVYKLIRKKLKIPASYKHYSNDTKKWIEEAHIFDYTDWGWIAPDGKSFKPAETDGTHTAILRRLAENPKLTRYGLSQYKETEYSATGKGWVRWLLDNNELRFNTTNWNTSIPVQRAMLDIVNKYLSAREFSFEWADKDRIGNNLYRRIEVQNSGDFILKLSGERRKRLMSEDQDYEIEMISGQLKKIIDLSTDTLNIIQNQSEIPSWVQDKISVSTHNAEAIFDYYHYSEEKIQEETQMKKVVIFPGGFHPFHKGHYSVYSAIKKEFPDADVYIASTNTQTERPFSFEDKKYLAGQLGVPEESFVQVKIPYVAKEITNNYDPKNTVVIFALSEKDADRISYTKKDGTPGYFAKWTGSDVQPFESKGYIYITPKIDFKVAGKQVDSASMIRKMYKEADDVMKKRIIKDMYPGGDVETIQAILDNNLSESIQESVEIISETIRCSKKTGKNICFVFSKKGKKLGGPYSETKAKKRLRQIEFFKHLNK
jgi:Family of unknown function (DUF5824)